MSDQRQNESCSSTRPFLDFLGRLLLRRICKADNDVSASALDLSLEAWPSQTTIRDLWYNWNPAPYWQVFYQFMFIGFMIIWYNLISFDIIWYYFILFDIVYDLFYIVWYYSRGNIPIFRKSSHTMFSSYSRPVFWYVTLIGISAQSGGNSWPTANPLNAPTQLSIPYVVPKQLWTLNELKAALIRKFPHLSTEEGQGCQR